MMVFGRPLFDPLESLNQARFMPAPAGTSPSVKLYGVCGIMGYMGYGLRGLRLY